MNSSGYWRKCSPDRIRLTRFIPLLLVLVLAWRALSPAFAQEACGNYAVAVAPQPTGHPLSDNAVILMTPSGEVARGDFDQPRSVEPSPKPGVALVRSLGGVLALMDVSTGALTPVQIPEDEQPGLSSTYPTIRNAPASDFLLLASGPEQYWLVDLTSGDALNLTTLVASGPLSVDSAVISPDGKWLIVYFQSTGLLVSLQEQHPPEPIDTDPLLPFPQFDDDSKVIYAVEHDGVPLIRSLDPDTGVRADVAKAPELQMLLLQQGVPLLFLDGQDLLILADGAAAPSMLFTWEIAPAGVLANAAGTQLLVADERDDATLWFWIDLPSKTSAELVELRDMSPVTSAGTSESVLFAPNGPIRTGVVGVPYRTVDLATGAVSTVLEQDSDDVYIARTAGDNAGRFSIINAVSPGSGRIWLADNLRGTATQVAASSGNTDARVSPDGCQLAVSVYDTIGEGRTSTVAVTSLVDGSPIMTIPDALLLGWAPAPSA